MEQLGYLDYLKLAFHRRLHVPGMGQMPLNYIGLGAFLLGGLLSGPLAPGVWLLGIACEVIYLYWVSTSPRFHKLIRGERQLETKAEQGQKAHAAVERLSPPSQYQYRKLLDQCRSILGISETLEGDSLGSIRDMRTQSLNQLLNLYLRLLTSREVIEATLANLDFEVLANEVAGLQERVDSAEGSALKRSLQATLEIQRKRLENHTEASSTLEVIGAELTRISQQVELIREEAAVSGKAELISTRLDAVTSNMSETSRWMDEHAEFFGTLESSDAMSGLPDLPPLEEG